MVKPEGEETLKIKDTQHTRSRNFLRELSKSRPCAFNPEIDAIPNLVIDMQVLSSRGAASENAS